MSDLEWAAYVAMALAYGLAFDYSVRKSVDTKLARFFVAIFSAIVGVAWIVTMPMFSFFMLINAGQRARS